MTCLSYPPKGGGFKPGEWKLNKAAELRAEKVLFASYCKSCAGARL
jgi:hypothetical protein